MTTIDEDIRKIAKELQKMVEKAALRKVGKSKGPEYEAANLEIINKMIEAFNKAHSKMWNYRQARQKLKEETK